jgi:hypothetical protein
MSNVLFFGFQVYKNVIKICDIELIKKLFKYVIN